MEVPDPNLSRINHFTSTVITIGNRSHALPYQKGKGKQKEGKLEREKGKKQKPWCHEEFQT